MFLESILLADKVSTYLRVNDEKPYHSSAVYAAALHSLSLPFRMDLLGPTAVSECTSGALDINGIVQMLSGNPRQNMVAILDATMPASAIGIYLLNCPGFPLQVTNSIFSYFLLFSCVFIVRGTQGNQLRNHFRANCSR